MRPRSFGLTVNKQEKATQGYTLYSPQWGNKTNLIDMDGNLVHDWDLPGYPGGYARLLPNGNLFYAA